MNIKYTELKVSGIVSAIVTTIIFMIDRFVFKHTIFDPLQAWQFYLLLFIITFGFILIMCLSQDTLTTDNQPMVTKKQLKKSKKAKKQS